MESTLTTTNGKPATVVTSDLASEINTEHQACMQAAGKAIDHALRCGDLLIEAKGTCQHGEWQGWLAEHFKGAARTARGYMQLADNRELLESKRRTSAVLGIDGALKLLASPKPMAKKLQFHEIASFIPLMGKEDIAALAESIKQLGQIHPIALFEGKILDGRCRYLACDQAGIECQTCTVEPADPWSYVLSLNVHRQHYTKDQIAMGLARAAKLQAEIDRHPEKQKASATPKNCLDPYSPLDVDDATARPQRMKC